MNEMEQSESLQSMRKKNIKKYAMHFHIWTVETTGPVEIYIHIWKIKVASCNYTHLQ